MVECLTRDRGPARSSLTSVSALWSLSKTHYIPRKLCLWWVYCFHVVRPSVRPSVTFCFLNNSKSHCWIFIKPCKHVHICKTNTFSDFIWDFGKLPFLTHLGKYFIKIGKIIAKIHEIGKIKATFGLGMTPIYGLKNG